MDLVRPSWSDTRALLMTRNAIATHLWALSSHDYRDPSKDPLPVPLPPLLKSPHDCQHCFQAAECLLLHAALEGGSEASSGAPQLFSSVLRGLTQTHLLYVKQWVRMLALEAAAVASPVRASMDHQHQQHQQVEGQPLFRFVSCRPAAAAGDADAAKYLLELSFDASSISSEAQTGLGGLPGGGGGGGLMMEEMQLSTGDRVTVSVVANTKRLTEDDDADDVAGDDDLLTLVEPDLCTGSICALDHHLSASTLSIMLNDHPKRLMR